MANYEWESVTLGQNPEIQKIASAAAKASELVTTNIGLAKSGLKLAQAFLIGIINPKVILLNAIADEIDNFVSDFKGTGFYILEVVPTGLEVIPRKLDGTPITLAMSSSAIKDKMDAAIAADSANMDLWTRNSLTKEPPNIRFWLKKIKEERNRHKINFKKWAKRNLKGEELSSHPWQMPETFPSKATYQVESGKSKASYDDDEGVGDDSQCTIHPIFNIPMLSSTEVIAQIIGAMDDELDDRRPQFSKSAEVGAIIMVIGFEDLTKTWKLILETVDLFIDFFGGDQGIAIGGFKKTKNLLAAPIKVFTDGPSDEDAQTFTVNNVGLVKGTEGNKMALAGKYDGPWVFSGGFEEGDFVVGPRVKFGARVQGFVSEIVSDDVEDTPYAPYRTQTLKITGASKLDTEGWKTLANGATIQQASAIIEIEETINENSAEIITKEVNGFNYFTDLENNSDGSEILAQTKVKLVEGEALLQPDGDKKNVYATGMPSGLHTIQCVMGTIFEPKKKKAPPPNFKSAKLEDLIGDFNSFFSAFNTLANSIRSMAGASDTALDEMIDFLDKLIEKLDEINKSLQKILKIFSVGLPAGGVYVLSIPPTIGGNDAIKEAIETATNKPSDRLDFAMGYMMMGGGPSMKVLNKLLAG